MFHAHKSTLIHSAFGVVLAGILVGLGIFVRDYIKTKNTLKNIEQTQSSFKTNFEEELFRDQLKVDLSFALNQELQAVQLELEKLVNQEDTYSLVPEIFDNYTDFVANLSQNKKVKIDTAEAEAAATTWAQMLLDQEFEELNTLIEEQNTKLDADYQKYLASLPPPPAASAGEGYSYQTVNTEKGTFGAYLIKVPLSSVRVVTASASGDDCSGGCPTKSLAQHVQDNGGYAGMNGTYFCPPDYAECSGKTNSFDYALHKSSSGKWINDNALGWSDTGLMTFNGSTPKFYKKSTEYGGGSVTAGISNYPSLLKDGDVVVNNDKLTSFQKSVKGLRGVIGVGETNLYLAIITGATVEDAAYAARALGMKHALNLDGGGSSAMYINGGYVIGPGRSLPNAVVLTK